MQNPDTRLDTPVPFLIHPQYADFVRGKSPTLPPPTSLYAMLMIGLIYSAMPVLMILTVGQLLWRDYANARELEEEGVSANGVILGLDTETDSEGSTSYYIKYEFWVNDTRFSATDSVSEDFYENAEYGQSTPVRYVPHHPDNSEIAGEEQNWRLFAAIGGAMGGGLLLGMVYGLWRAYRAIGKIQMVRRLPQMAQWLEGNIHQSELFEDSEGDFTLKIVAHFISPRTDKTITQKFSLLRNDLPTAPAVDTPVWVLYQDDRHYLFL